MPASMKIHRGDRWSSRRPVVNAPSWLACISIVCVLGDWWCSIYVPCPQHVYSTCVLHMGLLIRLRGLRAHFFSKPYRLRVKKQRKTDRYFFILNLQVEVSLGFSTACALLVSYNDSLSFCNSDARVASSLISGSVLNQNEHSVDRVPRGHRMLELARRENLSS